MANTTLQDKMKLAATSFASNDFGAALTSFQECLEMTTNEKALRIIQTNIGATYQRMSKFEDALKAFDSALSYDDTYLQALFNKGVTLKALNKNAYVDTVIPYWEGPVSFTGSHKGFGYLEMTGY